MVQTIKEASVEVGRSANWFRAGIRLGKISARKAGRTYILDNKEVARIKADPPQITREEMKRC